MAPNQATQIAYIQQKIAYLATLLNDYQISDCLLIIGVKCISLSTQLPDLHCVFRPSISQCDENSEYLYLEAWFGCSVYQALNPDNVMKP